MYRSVLWLNLRLHLCPPCCLISLCCLRSGGSCTQQVHHPGIYIAVHAHGRELYGGTLYNGTSGPWKMSFSIGRLESLHLRHYGGDVMSVCPFSSGYWLEPVSFYQIIYQANVIHVRCKYGMTNACKMKQCCARNTISI